MLPMVYIARFLIIVILPLSWLVDCHKRKTISVVTSSYDSTTSAEVELHN